MYLPKLHKELQDASAFVLSYDHSRERQEQEIRLLLSWVLFRVQITLDIKRP